MVLVTVVKSSGACSNQAASRMIEDPRRHSSQLSYVKAASKKMAKPDTEPLQVLAKNLEFLDVSPDMFEWPFKKRPLEMSSDEIMALNLFDLCILSFMLDREGSQSLGLV